MRTAKTCVESLERRMMLNAAVEVWAGNSDLRTVSDPASAFQSIDQQGYTKIGESNAANTSIPFSSASGYKYFVIATRGRVQVDSIQGSSGAYVSQINWAGNVQNATNATGGPNNVYATVGTATSEGTYAGYMLAVAPTTWTGITVKTGTVAPMLLLDINQSAQYTQGSTTPYALDAQVEVQDNGLITGASVHTPAGRWFTLTQSEGRRRWKYEEFFGTRAQMNSAMGDGIYSLVVQTPMGMKTYAFNGSAVAPTQVPATSSLTHGQVNAPTSLTIAWPAITDSSVGSVNVDIEDASENLVYANGNTPSGRSVGPIALASATSYDAKLRYENSRISLSADGYYLNYSKGNELGIVFATTGFVQGTPDLFCSSISAVPATVNPGGNVTVNLSVGSSGGIIVASGPAPKQPVYHQIGLSKDKVWGNSDDVLLFTPYEAGDTAGWGFAGTMQWPVPQNAQPGQYYLFGRMDAGNAVTESSEANNLTWSASPVITIPGQAVTLDAVSHTLNVAGTTGADTITVQLDSQTVYATVNGVTRFFPKASVTGIFISGDAGNDNITLTGALPGALVYGGAGNDTISASAGNDKIYGNDGDDRIFGNDGADSVYGGLGADSIDGGTGNDSLIGGDLSDTILGGIGDDYIEGKGKNDTLYGGAGNDTILGGAGNNLINGDDGNDKIYAQNTTAFRDTINGGAGTDAGQYDTNDVLTSVEQSLLA